MAATARDRERLQGVHPKVVAAILAILDTLPMFVVVGVRTATEQHTLFLKVPAVTHCDGYTLRSNHQTHPSDGLGHAVDCAWLGGDPFNPNHDWQAYGAAVASYGLIWGGTWHMVDMPHAELP